MLKSEKKWWEKLQSQWTYEGQLLKGEVSGPSIFDEKQKGIFGLAFSKVFRNSLVSFVARNLGEISDVYEEGWLATLIGIDPITYKKGVSLATASIIYRLPWNIVKLVTVFPLAITDCSLRLISDSLWKWCESNWMDTKRVKTDPTTSKYREKDSLSYSGIAFNTFLTFGFAVAFLYYALHFTVKAAYLLVRAGLMPEQSAKSGYSISKWLGRLSLGFSVSLAVVVTVFTAGIVGVPYLAAFGSSLISAPIIGKIALPIASFLHKIGSVFSSIIASGVATYSVAGSFFLIKSQTAAQNYSLNTVYVNTLKNETEIIDILTTNIRDIIPEIMKTLKKELADKLNIAYTDQEDLKTIFSKLDAKLTLRKDSKFDEWDTLKKEIISLYSDDSNRSSQRSHDSSYSNHNSVFDGAEAIITDIKNFANSIVSPFSTDSSQGNLDLSPPERESERSISPSIPSQDRGTYAKVSQDLDILGERDLTSLFDIPATGGAKPPLHPYPSHSFLPSESSLETREPDYIPVGSAGSASSILLSKMNPFSESSLGTLAPSSSSPLGNASSISSIDSTRTDVLEGTVKLTFDR